MTIRKNGNVSEKINFLLLDSFCSKESFELDKFPQIHVYLRKDFRLYCTTMNRVGSRGEEKPEIEHLTLPFFKIKMLSSQH